MQSQMKDNKSIFKLPTLKLFKVVKGKKAFSVLSKRSFFRACIN